MDGIQGTQDASGDLLATSDSDLVLADRNSGIGKADRSRQRSLGGSECR